MGVEHRGRGLLIKKGSGELNRKKCQPQESPPPQRSCPLCTRPSLDQWDWTELGRTGPRPMQFSPCSVGAYHPESDTPLRKCAQPARGQVRNCLGEQGEVNRETGSRRPISAPSSRLAQARTWQGQAGRWAHGLHKDTLLLLQLLQQCQHRVHHCRRLHPQVQAQCLLSPPAPAAKPHSHLQQKREDPPHHHLMGLKCRVLMPLFSMQTEAQGTAVEKWDSGRAEGLGLFPSRTW